VGECLFKEEGRSASCWCWSAWLSLFHWPPGGFKQDSKLFWWLLPLKT